MKIRSLGTNEWILKFFPKNIHSNKISIKYNLEGLTITVMFEDYMGKIVDKVYEKFSFYGITYELEEFIVKEFGEDYLLNECKEMYLNKKLKKKGLM